MIHVILRLSKKILRVLKERKTLAYAGIYILLLWVMGALIFHLTENVSLFDAFYWVVTTTTTVGYGDITPSTSLGKALSIFVMISGIGVLGLFLASVAEVLIEESLRRRHVRAYMKGHVVVLGWDKKLEVAVKELLKAGMEIVVVAEVDDIPIEHDNLVFVKGDPTDDENLERACVRDAKFALISGRDDTETLLAAIAVKKINEDVQAICIVSDAKVKRALERLGIEQVISVDEFFGLVLSRSVFAPKLSMLLNELMDVEGMDIHQNKLPGLKGKRVMDVMTELKNKYNAVPIGIVKKGKVIVNPEKEEVFEGDEDLIYIAEKRIEEGR